MTSAPSLASASLGPGRGQGHCGSTRVVLHSPEQLRVVQGTAQTPTVLIYQDELPEILGGINTHPFDLHGDLHKTFFTKLWKSCVFLNVASLFLPCMCIVRGRCSHDA